MIRISRHARPWRQKGRSGSVASTTAARLGSSAAGSRAAASQIRAARKAGALHSASVPAQPTVSAKPAAVAAAIAAPPMMPVVYSAMTVPNRAGKARLMTTGARAWISATPTPTTAALAIRPAVSFSAARTRQAPPISSAPSRTPRRSPSRRRNGRIDRAPRPIIRTGRVVSRLAAVEPMPVALSIRSSSGPTAAIAGRRFSARATMAASNSSDAPRVGAASDRVDMEDSG